MTTFIHHPTTDDLYKLMRAAVPECACFEFVGDNPYCPLHGKPAEPATIGEAECALFGNVYQPEGSELHLLEWEREVRETRESDRPL
jgi:hypothetical protein